MNPWEFLLSIIGNLLAFFYSIIPNYGISIIFLTVFINVLLFPLTLKQTRSMKAMQEIQPEVKKLQQEYKADREELQKQLMALYQERGVNPAAGCLPLILQMPVWFALFSVLRITGETINEDSAIPIDSNLGQALVDSNTNFLGMDLAITPNQAFGDSISGAIPYIILVLVVIVSGFYQQQQATRQRKDDSAPKKQPEGPAAGAQQALKWMPLLFGVFSWNFPAGLVVYFATSNIFRVGQQAVIFWLDGQDRGKGGNGAELAPPPPTDDGSTERSGPSPHASKKRSRRRRK